MIIDFHEFLSGLDPFFVFRRMLVIVVAVYTAVRLGQSGYWWIRLLYRPYRRSELVRRYVMVQLLRVRWQKFRRDYVRIGALGGVLAVLIWLHRVVETSG